MNEYAPLKEFRVKVSYHLDHKQENEAFEALTKHYTGDTQCNVLVDGQYVSKYPQIEKEVPMYPASHYNVVRSYQDYITVELLTDGTLRIKK